MFRGFKLNLDLDLEDRNNKTLFYKGIEVLNETSQTFKDNIQDYISVDDILDGTMIQNEWFKQIDAEIFISHSHKNVDIALILAGWLDENFGIKAFVDSAIWGYADKLIKIIDDEYCKNRFSYTYNYKKRNYSTSHIHMMLSTALGLMIDKTECLFFLNTPDSILVEDTIQKTESPWLYSEITLSQIIRTKDKEIHRSIIEKGMIKEGTINEGLQFRYKVGTNHLTDLNFNDLEDWLEKCRKETSIEYSLDVLYDLKPIKKNI